MEAGGPWSSGLPQTGHLFSLKAHLSGPEAMLLKTSLMMIVIASGLRRLGDPSSHEMFYCDPFSDPRGDCRSLEPEYSFDRAGRLLEPLRWSHTSHFLIRGMDFILSRTFPL